MKHSASRALALLRAMNSASVSSVADLSRATGITKPSVVRLLAILAEDGYVGRAEKPGSYILTSEVQGLASGYRGEIAIVQAAGAVMENLTARLDWPTALGLFEKDAMVVRYSTIPSSPLSWYRTTLHQRLPLLGSAMGLLHLAHASRSVRNELLLLVDPTREESPTLLETRFQAVRDKGYALRLPSIEHPTLSISVPLIANGQMVAAMSMTFFGKTISADSAIKRFFPELQQAAFKAVGGTSPL